MRALSNHQNDACKQKMRNAFLLLCVMPNLEVKIYFGAKCLRVQADHLKLFTYAKAQETS